MCGVPEAMLALQITQAFAGQQQTKSNAKAQENANKITEQNANLAYIKDLTNIENEKVEAARTFSYEVLKEKLEKDKERSVLLNKGFGNSFMVMRDLAGQQDRDYIEIQNAFLSDMYKANYQYDQAYSTYSQNVFKYTKTPTPPSSVALGLEIGAAGLDYSKDPKNIFNLPPKPAEIV